MSTNTLAKPVLVRNTKLGPTVFKDGNDGAEVVWQGANDPMGEDVQPVPVAFLSNSQFLSSLNRETFVIESADESLIAELGEHLNSPALKRQAEQWKAQKAGEQTATFDLIEDKALNDIVVVTCVGPATRGEGACGAEIPRKELGKNDHAPLCPKHEGFASQYVPTEDGNWVRAGLAPRRQHQSIVS